MTWIYSQGIVDLGRADFGPAVGARGCAGFRGVLRRGPVLSRDRGDTSGPDDCAEHGCLPSGQRDQTRVRGAGGLAQRLHRRPSAERGTIDWVHVRHEEGAAFAASADAELTGELAVCVGSCGPGNLHLVNGLFEANRSRVPVLAIAAQIPSAEIGSGYFQEPTRRSCSGSAASTPSSSGTRPRCRGSSRSPSAAALASGAGRRSS